MSPVRERRLSDADLSFGKGTSDAEERRPCRRDARTPGKRRCNLMRDRIFNHHKLVAIYIFKLNLTFHEYRNVVRRLKCVLNTVTHRDTAIKITAEEKLPDFAFEFGAVFHHLLVPDPILRYCALPRFR